MYVRDVKLIWECWDLSLFQKSEWETVWGSAFPEILYFQILRFDLPSSNLRSFLYFLKHLRSMSFFEKKKKIIIIWQSSFWDFSSQNLQSFLCFPKHISALLEILFSEIFALRKDGEIFSCGARFLHFSQHVVINTTCDSRTDFRPMQFMSELHDETLPARKRPICRHYTAVDANFRFYDHRLPVIRKALQRSLCSSSPTTFYRRLNGKTRL